MKLWGGRFAAGARDPLFESFSESFSTDHRLAAYDVRANLAWVNALGRARVLNGSEVRRLAKGLRSIETFIRKRPRWAAGEASEDVHTWVEARLEKLAGPVAGKLRTGRSRNDLVATDTRMFLKDSLRRVERSAVKLLRALVETARRHERALMPGFTHLQPAQPVLLAHYLLAYFEMIRRDVLRLEDCRARADELPLGAGALAGTSFPVDRVRLARELGFARVAANSLDATSDRDFVCEAIFDCAMVAVHLSRLAEDLIIFSSPAFGFVELSDAYSTGSSLMPQKKNPDSLELVRGRAARLLGRLTAALAVLKGLPLAYNRDLQEDKPALFDALDCCRDSLEIAARVVASLRVRVDRMEQAAEQGFLTATDLADELVRRGTPFAEAHEQVGKLVRFCVSKSATFRELTDSDAGRFIPRWDGELRSIAASTWNAVNRKDVIGGTGLRQVTRSLREAEETVRRLERGFSRES